MMIYNDLAFPVVCGGVTSEPEVSYGMTLRDYFAAAALPALITQYPTNPALAAVEAYYAADALLKVRSE